MTIFYSIIPEDIVFEGYEQYNPEYKELMVDGITMLVEMTSMTEGRIARLISPNPNDYLNPRYAPGQIVSFSPQII